VLWVVGVLVALALVAIPFVGWLLGLAAIAGLVVWHLLKRRTPPSRKYPTKVPT
jgi:hypothetical protein